MPSNLAINHVISQGSRAVLLSLRPAYYVRMVFQHCGSAMRYMAKVVNYYQGLTLRVALLPGAGKKIQNDLKGKCTIMMI